MRKKSLSHTQFSLRKNSIWEYEKCGNVNDMVSVSLCGGLFEGFFYAVETLDKQLHGERSQTAVGQVCRHPVLDHRRFS